jgi:hypothetical protein
MKRLRGGIEGEIFNETAQRLIAWKCTEAQAYALAQVVTLDRDTPDSEVEAIVIEALVTAKSVVSPIAEIEYVSGQRRDTLRLEGR